jgi:hypothetical protein
MKPPRLFKYYKKRGYSPCMGCGRYKLGNNIFFHEGTLWRLCIFDYFDYWENTDKLLPDFVDHDHKEWR